MPSLLERVTEALRPKYEVEGEIARGGMGVVYLGRNVALQQRVAIKVLSPEMASEDAMRRFLREARVLAQLDDHPNIVSVHDADAHDGLCYFVMDYVEGPTLGARLLAGPLSAPAVRKLGRDLLDALQRVHEHQLVHRDVKPGNIFVQGRDFLLADFGIATPRADSDATATGGVAGTPVYMAPEQYVADAVTPATDLYAVSMVLFEAWTGERWATGSHPTAARLRTVPRAYRALLRRGLAPAAAERWQDAKSYRRAWWNVRKRHYQHRAAALTVAGLVAGGAMVALWLSAPFASAATLQIGILPPSLSTGGAGVAFGDSVADELVSRLDGAADFEVCRCDGAGLRLRTEIEAFGDSVRFRLHTTEEIPSVQAAATGHAAAWRALLDTVVGEVLSDLWDRGNPLGASLPRGVGPATSAGVKAFVAAERLWLQARWREARDAYHVAVEVDSTCFLCSWRITEAERWLSEPPDLDHLSLAFAHLERFPVHYQHLIRARRLPVRERLEAITQSIDARPSFFLAWFARGDELFHRGPLLGRTRAQALEDLQQAARLGNGFRPALLHISWLALAAGDVRTAAEALDRAAPGSDDVSGANEVVLVQMALAARMGGLADALAGVPPAALDHPRAPAAPRLMPSFGSPEAAADLGVWFAAQGTRPSLQFAGLFAQYVGARLQGRPGDARTVAEALRALDYGRGAIDHFDTGLDATEFLFDPEMSQAPAGLPTRLRAVHGVGNPSMADDAAAFAVLVARRLQRPRPAIPSAGPWRTLLDADSLAQIGAFEEALQRTEPLREAELAATVVAGDTALMRAATSFGRSIFIRSTLHLMRAEWNDALGRHAEAVRELRWTRHVDFPDVPTGPPLAAEVDWALAGLASWRTADLLERQDASPEASCPVYREVGRRWGNGAPEYQARAAQAVDRYRVLECDRGPG